MHFRKILISISQQGAQRGEPLSSWYSCKELERTAGKVRGATVAHLSCLYHPSELIPRTNMDEHATTQQDLPHRRQSERRGSRGVARLRSKHCAKSSAQRRAAPCHFMVPLRRPDRVHRALDGLGPPSIRGRLLPKVERRAPCPARGHSLLGAEQRERPTATPTWSSYHPL